MLIPVVKFCQIYGGSSIAKSILKGKCLDNDDEY